MKKILTLLALLFTATNMFAQQLTEERDKIEATAKEMEQSISTFRAELADSDAQKCIDKLVRTTHNEYQQYIAGTVLYDIDKASSFRMQKEAYAKNPNNLYFTLEYAMALHRQGAYADAAVLYEKYSREKPDDRRINVWLADCYINTGDVTHALMNWDHADHSQNHTSIDFAICTIYGNTSQIFTRDSLRKEVSKGQVTALYPLIFLDMNWVSDWWNSGIQTELLATDMALGRKNLLKAKTDLRVVNAYMQVKRLSQNENTKDSITSVLKQAKLVLGDDPLPADGQMASDILRICFASKIVDEKEFYEKRGPSLLTAANATNDKELLNVYAYLQGTVNHKADTTIDKAGWKKFHDERFAVSYFMGKADANRYDDPELTQALVDFPNSSALFWVKTNCAKIEHKELKPLLIELIRKEFKTLGSDPSHTSYPLNSFFHELAGEQ